MAEDDLSKTIRRGRFARYAPLLLWIGLILFLSSALGATSRTSLIIRPLLEWLFPDASTETIALYHKYVRKLAHFIEYAILAFWAWRAFRGSGRELLQKYWYAVSFALVVSVASIDEFNQSFNTARTSSIYDTLLDISGGAAMILFLWLFTRNSSRQWNFRF